MTSAATHIQIEHYMRYHWMSEKAAIEYNRRQLMKSLQLLALIELAEKKYQVLLAQSMTNIFDLAFPEMKRKTLHDADIAKRAAIRLRAAYNTLVNEIML